MLEIVAYNSVFGKVSSKCHYVIDVVLADLADHVGDVFFGGSHTGEVGHYGNAVKILDA